MRLPKDIISGSYVKPRVFLCHPDKEKICQLDVIDLKGSFKFNSYSEITFEVARTYNDLFTGETKVNPFYDLIEALRLIYIEDFGYFELQGPELVSDGIKEAKSCTAYSLEYTLSQKYLEDFYINTGEIGSVEVTYAENKYGADKASNHIVPVTLYNPNNTDLSLLHLILAKDYAGWKIYHVDHSLQKISRSFDIDRESIYDFLMNEVCEKFNCYIDFDTEKMEISVYAESPVVKITGANGERKTFAVETGSTPLSEIKTVSIDGYKTTQWEYNIANDKGYITLDTAPAAGSIIEVIGVDSRWDSDVFVTFDNLSQEIEINYDADEIKTVLSVTFGDDYDIREVNLGLPYITDLSYYYTPEWMGQDLYDAYTKYLKKCNDVQTTYSQNAQKMLELNGRIDFEENRLSLEYSEISVSSETVGTYYVRGGDSSSGYYYTEVSLPESYNANTTYYSLDTANLNETKVDNLYKVLQKYLCVDNTGWEEEFDKLVDDFQFMNSYVYNINRLKNELKSPSNINDIETSIHKFLEQMFEELGRTPLNEQYYQKYKVTQTTQIEGGLSQKSHKQYGHYYATVLMLNAIESENFERQLKITDYEKEYKIYQAANTTITNSLLMDKNFTAAQLQRLNAFLREDELQLDDIVITDEDSLADTFKMQQDAMETARIELQKISQPQMQFTMSMANIYALPEFEPIVEQFKLGNIIKVGLRPDYIKQSRLLQVDINFEDFSDFSCEFGELTKLRTQSDIHADLLSQAVQAGKSVATNSSYWTKGANQANSIDVRLEEGLLNSIDAIKSIDGTQNAYIDKYGIHLEAVNPNTGEIDDKRVWLVNNQIVFTDDGFKTTKSVLGEFTVDGTTYYGLLAQAVIAGLVEGSTIKGGTIQIGEFIEDGIKKYRFEVDSEGHVTMNAASVTGYVKDGDLTTAIEASEGKLTTTISNGLTELASKVPHYGDCRTAAATQKKVVRCDSFEPKVGDVLIVKFDYKNTANMPTLRIANGSEEIIYPVYIYGMSLFEDSVYNWGDNTVVTFVCDEAYEPDGTPILAWHISDNSSEQVYSKIEQTAGEIRQEVSETYVTNDTLGNYSTTEQMNSAISQKADSITSTVSKTYATLGQVSHYGTCSTYPTTAVKVVECEGFTLYKGASIAVKFTWPNDVEGPKLNVNNTGAKNIAADDYESLAKNSNYNWDANSTVTFIYDGTYWRIADSGALKRTKNLSSRITQTASDITLEVERATEAEAELSSKIKLEADKIALVVQENSAGTSFELKPSAVRVAWNNSNDYIEFANGEINMYTSSSHSTSNLFAKYNNNGAWYYRSGSTVGHIGTNSYKSDNNYKGLVFDLEYNAGYMCWAAKDTSNADAYTIKLIYHHKGTKEKQGLHFSCNTYADNNLYLTDDYRFTTVAYNDGTKHSAFDGAMTWGFVSGSSFSSAITIDGWNKEMAVHGGATCEFNGNSTLTVYNNVTVDFHSNIDMNTWSILNQSDARLKTNIQDTQVSAIDLISQIEMKEFDWIESQEHEEIGVIAQQLQTIMPNLVHEDPSTSRLSIKTTKFIPYLIKAIQELADYIRGDVALMSLRDTWTDPYTSAEKEEFIDLVSSKYNKYDDSSDTLTVVEKEPILLPIDTKGEEINE